MNRHVAIFFSAAAGTFAALALAAAIIFAIWKRKAGEDAHMVEMADQYQRFLNDCRNLSDDYDKYAVFIETASPDNSSDVTNNLAYQHWTESYSTLLAVERRPDLAELLQHSGEPYKDFHEAFASFDLVADLTHAFPYPMADDDAKIQRLLNHQPLFLLVSTNGVQLRPLETKSNIN